MPRPSLQALMFACSCIACTSPMQPEPLPTVDITQPAAPSEMPAVPAADSDTPPQPPKDPATPPAGWSSFGADLENTRSAPWFELAPSELNQLAVARDITAPGVTSTVAVYDAAMYWADWGGVVHATSLDDFSEIWRVDSAAMGGGYIGSPTVTERAVYVANRNGRLNALDRTSGQILWEAKLDAGPHTCIWSSPAVTELDGVLVIGLSNRGTSDNGIPVAEAQLKTFRGAVIGVDTHNGNILWRFETSAAPLGAGVGVWSSAALDLERGLAFIGTGNNFYAPVSPLSDSLLALDYHTGALQWSVQYTKNDAWTSGSIGEGGQNADVAAPPNLFDYGGQALVGVGDKSGRYHVHDRATGKLLWERTLRNGRYKGGIIAPAAYQNETIYVASNNDYEKSMVYALQAKDGVERWHHELPAAVWGGLAATEQLLFVTIAHGEAYALDVTSGEQRWQSTLPNGTGGGISLTCKAVILGHGYQDFETAAEPVTGGLRIYAAPQSSGCR